MKIVICFIVLFVVSQQRIKVDPETQLFIDENGLYRIFHGVNVIYKLFPYVPETIVWDPMNSFTAKDGEMLREWGQNIIRLYVSWKGFETSPKNYNLTYLAEIKKVIRIAAQYDIQVILDMHQDLLSEYFCGEGVPDFYVMNNESFPSPYNYNFSRNEFNYPNITQCRENSFFLYYFSYDVSQFSEDFITNVNNLSDHFADFWGHVAQYYRNEPNLLGYELLNEPWGISPWKHPFQFFTPGFQNTKYLLPFYNILNKKIRSYDNETLVFYEPYVTDVFSGGFKTNVGGPEYRDREVLSYHVYCGLVNPYGAPYSQILCDYLDNLFLDGKLKNIQDLKIGGFLTEFGALDNSTGSIQELQRMMKIVGSKFQSSSYWQYKYYEDITTAAPSPDVEGFWDSQGYFQKNKVEALALPYASAICGLPVNYSFEYETKIMILTIKRDRKCLNGSLTEIFVSESMIYAQTGYNYGFDNCNSCLLQAGRIKGYFNIVGADSVPLGENYTIIITPK